MDFAVILLGNAPRLENDVDACGMTQRARNSGKQFDKHVYIIQKLLVVRRSDHRDAVFPKPEFLGAF